MSPLRAKIRCHHIAATRGSYRQSFVSYHPRKRQHVDMLRAGASQYGRAGRECGTRSLDVVHQKNSRPSHALGVADTEGPRRDVLLAGGGAETLLGLGRTLPLEHAGRP
jgi:hypothetical protein